MKSHASLTFLMIKMNQHYLPQLYLNNFTASDDPKRQGPYLWVFRNGRWDPQPPRSTASAPDFYSFKDTQGNTDHSVENFFQKLETNFAPIITRLASSPPDALSDNDRSWLSLLIVSIRLRVPGYIDSFAEGIEDLYKQVHGLLYQQFEEDPSNFERAKEWLRTEKQINLPEMNLEDIHPDKYAVNVPNAYVVTASLNSLTKLAHLISQMNWTLYALDSPGFITSDYPVVSMTPGATNRFFSSGWGNLSAEVTFPLTSKLGLLCNWKAQSRFTLCRPTIEQLRTMNLRTIRSATNFKIISPSKIFPGSDIIEKAIIDSETAISGI